MTKFNDENSIFAQWHAEVQKRIDAPLTVTRFYFHPELQLWHLEKRKKTVPNP